MSSTNLSQQLIWEWGTGYEMFTSLYVLHKPNRFGLRGAWAKGVRARLPDEARTFLGKVIGFWDPFSWIHTLPAPKDGETVLRSLAEVSPGERLSLLTLDRKAPPEAVRIFQKVKERRTWKDRDRESLWELLGKKHFDISQDNLASLLDFWADPVAFGEQCLEALKMYQQVFFAEEETRIRPALEDAIMEAKELAEKLSLPELMEELSQGVRFEVPPQKESFVLVPSFWISPLIILREIDEMKELFIFGARPSDASLVPGETVPDALYRSLKALADPTRLRILYYLSTEPMTPTDLAKQLRLRAPTVIHHLNTLRLAGLVYLSFKQEGDKRYAARMNRIWETFTQLESFLGADVMGGGQAE